MKLKRFLLRYHPPGIILEYLRKNGEIETKSIDFHCNRDAIVTPQFFLFQLAQQTSPKALYCNCH